MYSLSDFQYNIQEYVNMDLRKYVIYSCFIIQFDYLSDLFTTPDLKKVLDLENMVFKVKQYSSMIPLSIPIYCQYNMNLYMESIPYCIKLLV